MNTTLHEMTSAVTGRVSNFREQRFFFVRLTMFAADPFDPYPLGNQGGQSAHEHFRTLLCEAMQRKTDLVRLRYLPRTLIFDDHAPDLPPGSHLVPHRVGCVFLEGHWSASNLRKASRKSLKRSEKSLRLLDKVSFEEVRNTADRLTACKRMLEWKRSWLRRRLKVAAGFNDPVFQNTLIEKFGGEDPDTYRVFSLLVGGKPVAYEFCVQSGTRLLSLIASFDRRLARFGPGRLLTAFVLEHAQHLHFDTYDMLPPETDFKKSFANRTEDFFELIVPRTRVGKVCLWLAEKLRKI